MPPMPSRLQIWTTHTTSDGRTYYFNSQSKITTWEKPEELKTPFERALAALPWKEFTDKGSGKKYYYNANTKQTVWEMPLEWKELLDKKESGELPDELPSETNGLGTPDSAARTEPDRADVVVEFKTREEAEDAFIEMLKEHNISSTYTWEQAMRSIVADPMYRALKTLSERKQAFVRYTEERRRHEREEQRKKFVRDREAYRAMLESMPEIKPTTRWRRALSRIKDKPEFLAIANDKEREELFEQYVDELRRKDIEEQRALRRRNVDKLKGLLAKHGVGLFTRWKEAQALYTADPEFAEDKQLQAMDSLDFLATFEDYIRGLEAEDTEAKRRAETMKRRRERNNREAFWGLLQDLVERGVLTTTTKWKQIFPVIKDDPRYLHMLGQGGSNPLEMFWDIQYDMEERYQTERRLVSDMMRNLNIVVNLDTSFPLFLAQFSDERINTVDKSILRMVFEEQLAKAQHRQREERRREEKRLRKKLDALKQALKRLDPPVTGESSWDEVQPRVAGKADVEGVPEDMQAEVFEKLRRRIAENLPDSEPEEDEREREREERKRRRERSEERPRKEAARRDRSDDRAKRDSRRDRSEDRRRRDRSSDERAKRDRDERGRRDGSRERRSGTKHRERSLGSDEEKERRKKRKEDEEIEEGEIV
ncbi:hypothetical protein DFJ74DRAFT_705791 [Hyaloraphidium curvatum]|nr:hypothetical protein DFJ74DRAFT_705791 [Hyaloraphidium curvatum]